MKKLLLCTTALVGFVAGSACAAEDVKDVMVSFSGQSKFEAGTKHQDTNHEAPLSYSPNQKSSAFYTQQKASLKAEGKTDSLTYGAVLRLQTIGDSSNGMSSTRNDRSHIYLDTDAGTVQLGSNFAASKLMQVDASTIASATGGVDGDWTNFLGTSVWDVPANSGSINVDGRNITISQYAASFANSASIQGVDTLANRLDYKGESARKITYLSPRISGMQLGVSFTPDINNNGGNDVVRNGMLDDSSMMYFGLPVRVKNVWSLGLNYTNTFDDVNVSFSAVADRGKAVRQNISGTITDVYGNTKSFATDKVRDLKTYSIGAVVGKNGFSVAASYHDDGQSLTSTAEDRFKSHWWTAGIAYENGPMSTSLTYLSGVKGFKNGGQTLKTEIISLGADYEVAPGLKPFAEVTMVKFKPKDTQSGYFPDGSSYDTSKAKGTVFMMGTKLKF